MCLCVCQCCVCVCVLTRRTLPLERVCLIGGGSGAMPLAISTTREEEVRVPTTHPLLLPPPPPSLICDERIRQQQYQQYAPLQYAWRRSNLTMRGVQWRRSMAEGRQPTAACPPRVYPCYPFRVGSSRATTLSDAATSMRMWRELLLISRLEASPFFYNEPLIGTCNPFQFWSSTTPPCDSRVMRGMCVGCIAAWRAAVCVCGVCLCECMV